MTTKDKILFAIRELTFYLVAFVSIVATAVIFAAMVIQSTHKIERFCATHPQFSESVVLAIVFSSAILVVSVAAAVISCWRRFRE